MIGKYTTQSGYTTHSGFTTQFTHEGILNRILPVYVGWNLLLWATRRLLKHPKTSGDGDSDGGGGGGGRGGGDGPRLPTPHAIEATLDACVST